LLTPQQLQKAKDIAYPELAFARLHDAKALQDIGASDEQKQKVNNLCSETSRTYQQLTFDRAEKWPSMFTPEQQVKLQKAAQRRIDATVSARRAGRQSFGGASGLAAVMMIGDEDNLPAYPELACGLVRRRLGFSDQQERLLGEIVKEVRRREAEFMKAARSAYRSPAEGTRLFEEGRKQLVAENRKQIEELLTPKQLAALNDFVLMRETANVLFDPDTIKAIEATDAQRAKLRQSFAETSKAGSLVWEQASQQALKLLTPRQHELLHEKFDREGWW
jgi:hypothetical protein